MIGQNEKGGQIYTIYSQNPLIGKQAKGFPYIIAWSNSDRSIYVGNEERGKEKGNN